jgi:hypothetical protein
LNGLLRKFSEDLELGNAPSFGDVGYAIEKLAFKVLLVKWKNVAEVMLSLPVFKKGKLNYLKSFAKSTISGMDSI